MAPVHVEAPPLSAHEAHPGVRQPEEWRQPGQKAVKKQHSDICVIGQHVTDLIQLFLILFTFKSCEICLEP